MKQCPNKQIKAKKTENNSSGIHKRDENLGKPLTPRLVRQTNTESHVLPELGQEILCVIDEFLQAQVDNPENKNPQGDQVKRRSAYLCEFSSRNHYQALPENI